MRQLLVFCWIVLLLCHAITQPKTTTRSYSFQPPPRSPPPPPQHPKQEYCTRRRALLLWRTAASSLMSVMIVSPTASAAEAAVAKSETNELDVSSLLRPATKNHPAIPFPSSLSKSSSSSSSQKLNQQQQQQQVLVEGLIYCPNAEDRDILIRRVPPNAVLMLTVARPRRPQPKREDSNDDPAPTTTTAATTEEDSASTTTVTDDNDSRSMEVFAGARIPWTIITQKPNGLSLRFQLTTRNLISQNRNKSNNVELENESDDDWIVHAQVMMMNDHDDDRDADDFTSDIVQATAVSKLLRLPNIPTPIRTPVSLPLSTKKIKTNRS